MSVTRVDNFDLHHIYGSMTGDNMKSELLGTGKLKLEGRQSLHRRRMSKSSPVLENGDIDADLTLAIEESLKCSKQTESTKASENQSSKTISTVNDETFACADESRTAKDDTQESKHLKELLLLHLDLIQQQQELILAKDRQIKSLKSEKETLKCRLERMERRMALLKQKGDAGDTLQMSDSMGASPAPSPSKYESQQRGQKRKNAQESSQQNKRWLCRQERREVVSTRSRDINLRVRSSSSQESSSLDESSADETVDTESCNSKVEPVRTIRKKCPPERPVFRTDTLYYVPYYIQTLPNPASTDQIVSEDDNEQIHVQVPGWRYNKITNCYTLEGTENLEDEVFIKRHQKPELEEKRRKRFILKLNETRPNVGLRSLEALQYCLGKQQNAIQLGWDIQRLREQKLYEKLQEGRCGTQKNAKAGSSADFTSFQPNPDKVQYIEVCDKVPVTAFGFPIPDLKPTDFELPQWVLSQKGDKSHGGRYKRR